MRVAFIWVLLSKNRASMVSTRRALTAGDVGKGAVAKKAKKTISLPSTSPPTRTSPTTSTSVANQTERTALFSLQDNDEELLHAKLLCRPSKRNRSPYVADISLDNDDDNNNRQAICHVPNLDMGGKCVADSQLMVRPARDRKGLKVRADAVSQKYGTPKCEFINQLLYVDESSLNQNDVVYTPTWVGAHPNLGERIAETWLRQGLVEGIPPVFKLESQVRNPCGAENMRSDFMLTLATNDGEEKRIVEVKTVVDTDYSTRAPPPPDLKCRFLSNATPYSRTAIFPWGKSNQKGPDGEKVVSARVIKHVRDLTKIAKGELPIAKDDDDDDSTTTTYSATILFVVIRGDAEAFRPNYEACPSFCRYLKQAQDSGVQVLAKRVSWDDQGVCYNDKMLPIEWES